MAQFRAEDEAHRVWMRGYFNGYVGDLEWAQEIRKNAARIVAGMEEVNTVPELKEPADSRSRNLCQKSLPEKIGELT